MFCINKAIDFISEQDHLSMAADWIQTQKITIDSIVLKSDLTVEQKCAIMKIYTASKSFTDEQKNVLRSIVSS